MRILVLGGFGLQGKSVSPVSSGYEVPEGKNNYHYPHNLFDHNVFVVLQEIDPKGNTTLRVWLE